jgi:hypothetical protein
MRQLSNLNLPPTAELFSIQQLVERHPNLLSEQRLRWAVRHRTQNGLVDSGAVYQSQTGGLLIREPTFLAWWLGLAGRKRPRAARR